MCAVRERLLVGGLVSLCSMVVSVVAAFGGTLAVPQLFGDHAVFQRNVPLPIWGVASPGVQVKVEMGGNVATARADDSGRWKVVLPPMKAGGPYVLTVSGGTETVQAKDVMVGEVWLCSGQSNMVFPVVRAAGGRQAVRSARYPLVRFLKMPLIRLPKPAREVKGRWVVCTPETASNFSAVGFFFAEMLVRDLKVPVGMIQAAWGGSVVDSWIPPQEVRGLPPSVRMNRPCSMKCNGMIAPLVPFPIRGVLWYQGESNVIRDKGRQYLPKFRALVEGWRREWKAPRMPFFYVQIAPFDYRRYRSTLHAMFLLWDAQRRFMDVVPDVGMVVTTDVGAFGNIHPSRKKPVAERLFRWAAAKVYGKKDVVFSGPLYDHVKVEGAKVRVFFRYVDGGLVSLDGKPLRGFSLAGADKQFRPASAVIDGDTVVVFSKDVTSPVAVRYGDREFAVLNLGNRAGLPASPFRSDDW